MSTGIHIAVACLSDEEYYRIFHTLMGISRNLKVEHWRNVTDAPTEDVHIVILDENDVSVSRYRDAINREDVFASSILASSGYFESKVRLLAGAGDDNLRLLNPSCSIFRVDMGSYSELLQRAVAHMEENLHTSFTQDDVADCLKMSRGHLSRMFRSETGCTYSDILNRLRYAHARELLKDPDVRVGEVAYRVGFKNADYFSHWFKEKSGMPPSDFHSETL